MPQVQYNPIKIILNIPDLTLDDTVIKRQAHLHSLNYNQENMFLVVTWIVKHYSKKPDDTYGSYLGDKIPDKIRETLADNTTIVNAQTGEIVLDLEQYKETILVDGDTIPEQHIPETEEVLGVDNDGNVITMTQPKLDENGQQIYTIIPEYVEQISQTIITIPYMGQYDWFNMIGETQTLNIHNMIRQYGDQVDWDIKLK